jgi:glutathione peroxidase
MTAEYYQTRCTPIRQWIRPARRIEYPYAAHGDPAGTSAAAHAARWGYLSFLDEKGVSMIRTGRAVGCLAGALLLGLAGAGPVAGDPARSAAAPGRCPSVLDHKLMNLQDEPVSLCEYRGKVLLVVNTASQCGYTPQYEGLEKLYRRYRDRGLVVLGFPANDFGGQEPGSNREIARFCQVNYGVSFPMFAKTSVVGAGANPVFRELAAQTGRPPRWNFSKYLVDRTGQPVASFASTVEPTDPQLTAQIERLLAAKP